MSIEDGRDYRNWLHHPEEHMAIKEKRQMLQFQCRVFRTALYNEKRAYDKLIRETPKREASYKPSYKTREELDAAYVVGAVSDQEYMRNRSAIWQCYSDRNHPKKIEWLESELKKYEDGLEELENWMQEKHQESRRAESKRRQRRNHFNAYRRGRRRKAKKEELERRWEKYGIG